MHRSRISVNYNTSKKKLWNCCKRNNKKKKWMLVSKILKSGEIRLIISRRKYINNIISESIRKTDEIIAFRIHRRRFSERNGNLFTYIIINTIRRYSVIMKNKKKSSSWVYIKKKSRKVGHIAKKKRCLYRNNNRCWIHW